MNVSKIREYSLADEISSSGRINFAKSDSKCSELPESIGIIEESYLSQSDKVAKLLDMVEVAFVKNLCNGNRHQAMLSTLFCICCIN
ncbi:hypothetical protein Tco_0735263 [Tanacetum coccineum]